MKMRAERSCFSREAAKLSARKNKLLAEEKRQEARKHGDQRTENRQIERQRRGEREREREEILYRIAVPSAARFSPRRIAELFLSSWSVVLALLRRWWRGASAAV
jgi:hypothetical protein